MKASIKQILSVVFILSLFSSCVTIQPIEFRRIDNFKGDYSIESPQAHFDLIIKNPNKYGITLTEISSQLFLNSTMISTVTLPTNRRIGPAAETAIPIEMNFNASNLLRLLTSSAPALLSGKLDSKLDGYIRLRKFIFSKKVPFSISQKLKR